MTSVHIAVIGGGTSGKLVQVAIPEATVYDWRAPHQSKETRAFGANYLWQPIGDLPCRAFPVVTRIDGHRPTLELARAYKQKIGKQDDLGSWAVQFQPEQTGYDFTAPLPATVQFDHRVTLIDRREHRLHFAHQDPVHYDWLVSTIPLYSLLSLLGIPQPADQLKFKPIYFKVMGRPPDAPHPPEVLHVNYLTNGLIVPYRYTDRFGERHYESIVPYEGSISTKRIAPGKIYAHPAVPGILEYLGSQGIITVGRYGSWAPDELLHQTYARILDWKETL